MEVELGDDPSVVSGVDPAGRIVRSVIHASGSVQGVGLRPWVCLEATALGLAGSVRNVRDGLEIEAEGPPAAIERLIEALRRAPPPARVDEIERVGAECRGDSHFRILASRAGDACESRRFPLLPDLATCDACMAEVLDPGSRRYGHAFASCARCGPRHSIATRLPWDRANTSMSVFEPCDACRFEHDDPRDRRFHAQTLCCPDCGPRLRLRSSDGRTLEHDDAALAAAAETLRQGGILAMLGLGGYQLLVNARDDAAVRRLRKRKQRPHKPLALAVADSAAALALVALGPRERAAFESPAGPIVLARRRADAAVAASVAPGVAWLGVMRGTTPLHRLLLEAVGAPLVATSGNRSGEPLCSTDEEAYRALGDVADAFLDHDRAVVNPVDDSVVREVGGRIVTLRCARGLTPLCLPRQRAGAPRVALGGDLKAAVGVATGAQILLGPHVGDLGSVRASEAASRNATALSALAGAPPSTLVADAHPDGHALRLARELDGRVRVVFHHHAHVLAGWSEHGGPLPVLGVAWDGTGFGPDRTAWGGELLCADAKGIERLVHLRHFPLVGGDAAAREPRRAALGVLWERFGAAAFERDDATLRAFDTGERRVLARALESGRLGPATSSAGRLFDAAASLLDVRHVCSFEAQAALELESLAAHDPEARAYPMRLRGRCLDWGPLLDAMLRDRDAGVPVGVIATRFHRGLACGIVEASLGAAARTGIRRVVLTGGCFQNALLSESTADGLEDAGLEPLLHERIPPNDGGLAVGQLQAVGLRPDDAGV